MEELAVDLQAGITATRAGNKEKARACFVRVLKADPRNETAWLWLSSVMPTTEEALRCVEQLLKINPNNKRAKEAQEVLRVRLLVEEAAIFKNATPSPSTPLRRYLLGEALVEANVISPQQLEQALKHQAAQARRHHPMRLGEILIRQKLVRHSQLEAALAAQIESAASIASKDATFSRIGEYLVQQGLITTAQLYQGIACQNALRQKGEKRMLGEALVELGYLQPDQFTRALTTVASRVPSLISLTNKRLSAPRFAPDLLHFSLTVSRLFVILSKPRGGVAEWLKAAVLKTAKRKLRGFESHRLLQGCSVRRDARVVNRAVC
jgi:tetratricopeptide (TPR) repeat protein